MNDDVRRMLAAPGRYAITNAGFRTHGRYVLVEVEADGTCHQLTPTGERDGVLARDGWNDDVRCYHVSENEKVFVRVTDPGERVLH